MTVHLSGHQNDYPLLESLSRSAGGARRKGRNGEHMGYVLLGKIHELSLRWNW
jgi:hypothetical protein